MIYRGEIDYIKKTITIEKKISLISSELKRNPVMINRILPIWSLERQIVQIGHISIDRFKYKVIRINVPFYSDWVILQNEYLPTQGEYFLN